MLFCQLFFRVALVVLYKNDLVAASGVRSFAKRMRVASGPFVKPGEDTLSELRNTPSDLFHEIEDQQKAIEALVEEQDSLLDLMETLVDANLLSFDTGAPSASPTVSTVPSQAPSVTSTPSLSHAPTMPVEPSQMPSVSLEPSVFPSHSPSLAPTVVSSNQPSIGPSGSAEPTSSVSDLPLETAAPTNVASVAPSTSLEPSLAPSTFFTSEPSAEPTVSLTPSQIPSQGPSVSPSETPSKLPSVAPSPMPSTTPSEFPSISQLPTHIPSSVPSSAPSIEPSEVPSTSPTLSGCGLSPEQRATAILAVLDTVTEPGLLRDETTSQGRAARWLIGQDALQICPDDEKLVQRFALATVYFATNGDEWFQCSASPLAADDCGNEEPFVASQRFLSPVSECLWAGIDCDPESCVTEIEFELNNLVGTIPTEIALLTNLQIWGMERGGLTGRIPTEIAKLTALTFLDLDFNQLTGSLSSELLSVSTLTQLDLNNNLLTGSVSGIGVFPAMEFLQIHDNFFTGTVPEAVGTFTNMAAFTLHETGISGAMPDSVCSLLVSEGGLLESLIADCAEPNPDISCPCCTDCRDT